MFASYIFLCTFVKYKITRDKMKTKEIKRQALEILNANGSGVKLSDFNVKQAKQVIAEHNFKLENN